MSVKVLILEDNPVAREFLSRVLKESFSDPITITEAGDLETARAQIALTGPGGLHGTDPFKLMLLDLELPDGNGLELLDELRQYPATKVVTTLYSDDEHLFPALQCGADGYLLKEDRFEVLVDELRKIVLGQPPLSPAIARRLLTHFRLGTGPAPAEPRPRQRFPSVPTCPAAAVRARRRCRSSGRSRCRTSRPARSRCSPTSARASRSRKSRT
jgi:DNA-binding NarL/FixJ family response regulator